MGLIQIIYASTAANNLATQDLRDILSVAKERNKGLNVTGFLCANRQFFLQCLEGEQSTVESLYDKISKDDRHHSVKVLSTDDIEARSFPEWSMSGVLDIDSHQSILAKFNSEKQFQPYELSSENSLNLLKEFSAFRGMGNR